MDIPKITDAAVPTAKKEPNPFADSVAALNKEWNEKDKRSEKAAALSVKDEKTAAKYTQLIRSAAKEIERTARVNRTDVKGVITLTFWLREQITRKGDDAENDTDGDDTAAA